MTLELSDQQVGHIMQVLAQRPYGEVCDLIAHIHRQAAGQVQQGPQGAAQGLRAINGGGEPLPQ